MTIRWLCMVMALFFITPALAKAPNVVVSLKPVHGLSAGVMAGVGEPGLLLAAVADPHSHALLPSQARSLASAEVVFWVGAKLERYLQRPLSNIAAKAQIVTLLDNPELRILPARRSGIWRPHDHEAGGEDHEAGGDHDSDPHFWLDPRNAQAIVRQAVMVLRKVDPDNGHLYSQNGDGMLYGLSVLEADLHRLLAPVRTLPYLVLHDAYQYFEAIRQRLRQGNVRCLFQEAEFNSNIVATLTEGSDIRVATLDPIGLRVRPGLGAYGQVLRQLAGALENCLSYSLCP